MMPFAAPLSDILLIARQKRAAMMARSARNPANDTHNVGPAHLRAALLFAGSGRAA